MISAFGVDHGLVYKAMVTPANYPRAGRAVNLSHKFKAAGKPDVAERALNVARKANKMKYTHLP